MIQRRPPIAAVVAVAAVAALAAAVPGHGASPPKAPAAVKAQVPVEEFTLDNGMKFLLVRKPEQATVNAGWVAHVGSANERPGITGVAAPGLPGTQEFEAELQYSYLRRSGTPAGRTRDM